MQTPSDKQVMMFTATLPEEVKMICAKYMRDVGLLSEKRTYRHLHSHF